MIEIKPHEKRVGEDSCHKNPRGTAHCRHLRITEHAGWVHTTHKCCWCGDATVSKTVLIPAHEEFQNG